MFCLQQRELRDVDGPRIELRPSEYQSDDVNDCPASLAEHP